MAYASLHLNYALDGFHPRWFRVVNIFIHSANSMLIYALLRLLLRRSPASDALPHGSVVPFPPQPPAAFCGASACHGAQLTYIIQRFTSLSTLFILPLRCGSSLHHFTPLHGQEGGR